MVFVFVLTVVYTTYLVDQLFNLVKYEDIILIFNPTFKVLKKVLFGKHMVVGCCCVRTFLKRGVYSSELEKHILLSVLAFSALSMICSIWIRIALVEKGVCVNEDDSLSSL